METASQIESRKSAERRQEEAKPTLIGQLKAIRDEWGEGFDEDIAAPLAQIIVTLRKGFAEQQAEQEREVDHMRERVYEAEQQAEENNGAADELRKMREDLEDVPRGVRSLEEVMAAHPEVSE